MPPQEVANEMIAPQQPTLVQQSSTGVTDNSTGTGTGTSSGSITSTVSRSRHTTTTKQQTDHVTHNNGPGINIRRTDDADIAAGATHSTNTTKHIVNKNLVRRIQFHDQAASASASASAATTAPSSYYNRDMHHQQAGNNSNNSNNNVYQYNALMGSETDIAVKLSLENSSHDDDKDEPQIHHRHSHTSHTRIHNYTSSSAHEQHQQIQQIQQPSSNVFIHNKLRNKQKTIKSTKTNQTSIHNNQILLLGINISNFSRKSQFIVCAIGVFSFSLLYGFLQELISVTLCNRQLGLFLGMMQFLGYAIWSRIFHLFVKSKQERYHNHHYQQQQLQQQQHPHQNNDENEKLKKSGPNVPLKLYVFLSLLRAIDAGMTNMAMAYVNYPAKTLMKSSRVVFTMLFGALIRRKKYKFIDYVVVTLMVSGLVIFMHADSKSSAIFQPLGIMMLTTSLLCDGAINNMSEGIMIQYNVGQDEFIYNLYSIAVIGIAGAAYVRGDFNDGLTYVITPGTWEEIQTNSDVRTWSVMGKFMALFLFSSAGFFGSSCSALITKEFGALTMSITSTARKATTLFLSFALFNNVCTVEHVSGILLFMTALVAKSFRASGGCGNRNRKSGKGHNDEEVESSDDDDDDGMIALAPPQEEELSHRDENTSVKRRRRRRKAVNVANIV